MSRVCSSTSAVTLALDVAISIERIVKIKNAPNTTAVGIKSEPSLALRPP
jgi:hypothetical protein